MHARPLLFLLLVPLLVLGLALAGTTPAGAVEAPVVLGVAQTFAVLGGSTVTNTGLSTISGDLGVSPGTAVVGFPPGIVSNGAIHAADALAASAQAAVTTAFNDASTRPATGAITADLGGQTLVSGVYAGGAVGLTGTVTFDGQGDADAVFIVRAASTLITASASNVAFIGDAQACNVFWVVGSSATLGTNSTFNGTILAQASITATTNVAITGRLLARTAAVTLDTNVVNRPTCAASATTTTTTSTIAPTTTTSTMASTTTTPIVGAGPTPSLPPPGGPGGAGAPSGGNPGVPGVLVPGVPVVVPGTPVPGAPRVPDDGSSITGDLPRTGSSPQLLVLSAGTLLVGLALVRSAPRRATASGR